MTDSVAPTRTCRFPGLPTGLARAPRKASADPRSTATTRHTIAAHQPVAAPPPPRPPAATVPDDVDRPVSMARARAGGEYADRVTAQVHTLTATLATVLAELRKQPVQLRGLELRPLIAELRGLQPEAVTVGHMTYGAPPGRWTSKAGSLVGAS